MAPGLSVRVVPAADLRKIIGEAAELGERGCSPDTQVQIPGARDAQHMHFDSLASSE